MVSLIKKLFAISWKCLVMRQRSWLISLLELVGPVLVMIVHHKLKRQLQVQPSVGLHHNQYAFNEISFFNDLNSWLGVLDTIAYTPSNGFTNQIMTDIYNISKKASGGGTGPYVALDTVELLEEWLYEQTSQFCKTCPIPEMTAVGVIFSNMDQKSKTFNYIIRSNSSIIRTEGEEFLSFGGIIKIDYGFVGLQLNLDRMFLKIAGVPDSAVDAVLLGNLDQFGNIKPELPSNDLLYLLFASLLILAYTFSVVSIVRDVIEEKSSGMKELMKIMGVSPWLIWVQWLIYCFMVQLLIIPIYTYVFMDLVNCNFLVVWSLFLFFTITCTVMLFVVTCLLNNSTTATVICVVAWNVIGITALFYSRLNKDLDRFKVILLCQFPLMNLFSALYTLYTYRLVGISWNVQHMFDRGYGTARVSVGESIIIFICETVVLTFILFYLDAVKPGPYGVARPTLIGLIIKRFTKWSTDEQDGSPLDYSQRKTFEQPPKDAKVGIALRGLQKRYGCFRIVTAVEDVNLDVYEGEIMAFLGHNGAGKTTTMSMITGLTSPTSGKVLFHGKDIRDGTSDFRDSLGFCPQHDLYLPRFTVLEHNIFFGMLRGMSYTEAKTNGIELLTLLKMTKKMNSKAAQLSGGMKRRLSLSIALIGNPKVVILDEPTSGLDPQSRRAIWDIVLGMRGQRIILITTHFMEEADVLGDRIAIMDHGAVVCCGTSMFLKELYGTGYTVHVLKEPAASTQEILELVQQSVPQPMMKVMSPTQVDLVVSKDHVNNFPKLFSDLEGQKRALKITGISVTSTTMEDVFLKVAATVEEEQYGKDSPKGNVASADDIAQHNVRGVLLFLQHVEALLWKRFRHRRVNIRSFLIRLIFTVLIVFLMVIAIKKWEIKTEFTTQKPLNVDLDLFSGSSSLVLFDEKGEKAADIASRMLREKKWKVFIVPSNLNFDEFVRQQLETDAAILDDLLMGLKFTNNQTTILLKQYNRFYLRCVAVNFVSNLLLRTSSTEGLAGGSIQVINHPFVLPWTKVTTDCRFIFLQNAFLGFLLPMLLLIPMMDVLYFLTEERSSGFKQQQIIAGVTPLTFHIVHFIFDFSSFLCIVFIYIILALIFVEEAFIEFLVVCVLVLFLYGASGLFYVYTFSLFARSKVLSGSLFILLNLLYLIIALIVYTVKDYTFSTFHIVQGLLSLNPVYAGSMALFKIFYSYNSMCGIDCKTKTCPQASTLLTITSDNYKSSALYNIICMAVAGIIYFILLVLIDYDFVRRCYPLRRNSIQPPDEDDEDVQNEFKRVMQVTELGHQNTIPLRSECISKRYCRGPRAVDKVSFAVFAEDCFGLLGVNGSGKTTLFKILVGELLQSSGNAYVFRHDIVRDKRQYQRLVGYCPQFNAILESLSGYDLLKILALQRGVPRQRVNAEVAGWLEMVGIAEHANKSSVKYSGGTKRKLGTAMAFIGDPAVVFMDEPTTGVDPVSRRQLWSVIQRCQRAGQSVVISSHSMEECEALCTRLTILKDGRMLCIGTSEYLKLKFSQGYTVLVKLFNPKEDQVVQFKREFVQLFPSSRIKDEHKGLINYQVEDPNTALSQLFSELLRLQRKHKFIEDFSVSNTTLEQLFLFFADKK